MPTQARKKNNNPETENKNVSALEKFTTMADSIPSCCKLCKKKGHPMSRCSTYASAQTRQARCRELNLCTLCTSTRHKTKDCLGKRNRLPFKCSLCNSRNHVTPLCDKAEEKKNSYCPLMCVTALALLTNPSSYLWYPFQCPRANRNTTSTVCLIPAARGHTFPRGWRKN